MVVVNKDKMIMFKTFFYKNVLGHKSQREELDAILFIFEVSIANVTFFPKLIFGTCKEKH